jgi:hypothetical protein
MRGSGSSKRIVPWPWSGLANGCVMRSRPRAAGATPTVPTVNVPSGANGEPANVGSID